jgi:HEAT repeat protein
VAGWTWVFWLLAALLGLGGAVLLYMALLSDRARGRLRCPRCWFDMAGAPSLVCPECGHDARTPARLKKTRRRYRIFSAALLLLLAGYANTRVPGLLAGDDWTKVVPGPVLRGIAPYFDDKGDDLLNAGFTMKPPTRWERVLLARASARCLEKYAAEHPVGATRDYRSMQAEQALQRCEGEAEAAVPVLLRMLRSSNEQDWRAAVRCLGIIGPNIPSLGPRVGELVSDPDPGMRLHGLSGLEAFPRRKDVTRIIVRALRDPDGGVRWAAARAFCIAGYDPSGEHLDAVVASIRDPEASTGRAGVAALASYGALGMPAMAALMDHPMVEVRLVVVSRLRGYGETGEPAPATIEGLRRALSDADDQVRYDAVRALREWETHARAAAKDLLRVAGDRDETELVRCAALMAAGRVGADPDQAVPVLAAALKDSEPSVRRCAAEGLRAMGASARGAETALAECAQDPQDSVRAEAQAALLAVRGDARP